MGKMGAADGGDGCGLMIYDPHSHDYMFLILRLFQYCQPSIGTRVKDVLHARTTAPKPPASSKRCFDSPSTW